MLTPELHGAIAELRMWAMKADATQETILLEAIRNMSDIIAEEMPTADLDPDDVDYAGDDMTHVTMKIVLPCISKQRTSKDRIALLTKLIMENY